MSLKVVEPIEINESILTSSSIAEPDVSVGEVEWIADNYDGAYRGAAISPSIDLAAFGSYFHTLIDRQQTSIAPSNAFVVNLFSEVGESTGYYFHTGFLDTSKDNPYASVAGNGADRVAWVGTLSDALKVRRSTASPVFPSSWNMDGAFDVTIIASPISGSTHAPTRVFCSSYIGTSIYVLFDSQTYLSGIACAIITDAGAVSIVEVSNYYNDSIPIGICDDGSNNPVVVFYDGENLYRSTYSSITATPTETVTLMPMQPSGADQYKGYAKIGSTYYSLVLDAQFFMEMKSDFTIHFGYNSGDEVIKSSNHTVYRSLVDGNLIDPEIGSTEDATATWIEVGPTNKWAAFDEKITTVSNSASTLTMVFNPSGYVNTIAFFGLSNVDSIDVEVKNQSDEVIYSNTINTIDITPIYDFYTYVFYQLALIAEIVDDVVTPVANPTITLTFNGTDIEVGLIAMGFANEIGRVLSDTKSETLDYSTREYDEFGELKDVPRPIINLNTYEILSDKSFNPYIQRLIKQLRSKNTLWIGDIGSGQKLITYGRYERSPIQYNMPNDVKYSITVRGSI